MGASATLYDDPTSTSPLVTALADRLRERIHEPAVSASIDLDTHLRRVASTVATSLQGGAATFTSEVSE